MRAPSDGLGGDGSTSATSVAGLLTWTPQAGSIRAEMSTPPRLQPHVVAELLAAVGGRDNLKAMADASRTEWWTGFGTHDPVPYVAKTNGWPAGRRVEEPTTKDSKVRSIGLDALGRAVVERRYWNDRLSAETFTVWRDDHAVVLHLEHGGIPEFTWAARWILEGGRAVAHERLSNEGWTIARTYEYDASGRLTCMRQPQLGDDRFDYEHDATGQLTGITRTFRDKTDVVFRAKPKGVRIGALLGTIEARLAEQIPAIVRRVATHEPAFCLALVYELEDGDVLPPRLAIGEASTREAHRSPESLWNPAEWRLIDVPELAYAPDPALEEACALANQLLSEAGDLEPARKTLAKLAAAIDPSSLGAMPRSDDFVVLALHGHDPQRMKSDLAVLARRLPADVKKRWKAARWI